VARATRFSAFAVDAIVATFTVRRSVATQRVVRSSLGPEGVTGKVRRAKQIIAITNERTYSAALSA
jgi:hypothetical protein